MGHDLADADRTDSRKHFRGSLGEDTSSRLWYPVVDSILRFWARLMATYFWIAVGSAIGGVSRYWLSGVVARSIGETFPWGTLIINVTGSFIIGFVATLTAPDGRVFMGSTARLGIMAGFCGGYTTFSSFSIQTLNLLNDGEWLYAGGNIVGSVTACLIAVWAGHVLALSINGMRWV